MREGADVSLEAEHPTDRRVGVLDAHLQLCRLRTDFMHLMFRECARVLVA